MSMPNYLDKIEEYNKLTLEELKVLFNKEKKCLGGVCKQALITVLMQKLRGLSLEEARLIKSTI